MTLESLKAPILNRSALCRLARIDYQSLMQRLKRGGPELTERERKAITKVLRSAGLAEITE